MSRPDAVRCYGPPGTGKTHRGMRYIEHQVRNGADPTAVAFVSFTNAACDEARRRVCQALDLYDYELGYCATLHALAKRALGIGQDGKEWLAEGKLLKEFAESYDYDLVATRKGASEDMEEIASSGGQDAVLRAIWDFGRSRLIWDAEAAWNAFEAYDPETALRVDYGRYLDFVRDYEGWKRSDYGAGFRRLYDYTDLLREVLEHPVALPVEVAVVDEAQDMTPLLWAVSDVLFTHATHRACLGDDDQAIYGYQGAAPELFNGRTAQRVVQLDQSRRLPRAVWELAQQVIRQNRNRVDKQFRPVTEEILRERRGAVEGVPDRLALEGAVDRVSGLHQLDLGNGESWMFLVRNWAHTSAITAELESLGIPYQIQGGQQYSPWSDKGPLRAVKAIYALSSGERIKFADLQPLLDKTRAETREKPGAWQYGQKARIKDRIEQDPDARVSLVDLPHLGLTEWGFDCIAARDLELLRGSISQRDLDAYQAAQERGTWGLDPGQYVVSTIHGVKGQEADNVAALMSCTLAPAKNLQREDRREEEIRLAYVAITRALKRFFGVALGVGHPYEVFGV